MKNSVKRFFYLSPLILQTLIWLPTRFFLLAFVRFDVRGLENLEHMKDSARIKTGETGKTDKIGKKGVIFAANHRSELDPILVPAALPFLSPFMPIFYTSRPRRFYEDSGFKQIFYGGFLFKLWGAHPVVEGMKDYEKSLVNHTRLIEDGKSVLIFPEGGIPGRGGVTGKAHGGVAYLAIRTGCPIIPIHIDGAKQVRPGEFFLRKRKITVTFGAPIFVGAVAEAVPVVGAASVVEAVPVPQSIETYKEIAESVMEKVKVL